MSLKCFKICHNGDSYIRLKISNSDMRIINTISPDYEWIDLSDYIEIEETIDWESNDRWQYEAYNGSDRSVTINAYMEVEDSSGICWSREYNYEVVESGGTFVFYIETGGDMISYSYLYITFEAEEAEEFDYEGGYH